MHTHELDTGVVSLGWLRDFPDPRDYTRKSPEVKPFQIASDSFGDVAAPTLPDEVDLRTAIDLPAIKDQAQLGSCTANAACYMYETYLRNLNIVGEPLSRLFLYKVSRMLMKTKGDVGSYLRIAMQALATFGTVPERFWPYDVRTYENEPTAFLHAMAQNYQALTYYRLDPAGETVDKVLSSIKVNLSAHRPCIFGFTVYTNLRSSGDIQMPGPRDRVSGGHAICCVGYSDTYTIPNSGQGALLIANSWGKSWGKNGFGWLPYDYVRKGLATDWWTVHKAEWLEVNVFR